MSTGEAPEASAPGRTDACRASDVTEDTGNARSGTNKPGFWLKPTQPGTHCSAAESGTALSGAATGASGRPPAAGPPGSGASTLSWPRAGRAGGQKAWPLGVSGERKRSDTGSEGCAAAHEHRDHGAALEPDAPHGTKRPFPSPLLTRTGRKGAASCLWRAGWALRAADSPTREAAARGLLPWWSFTGLGTCTRCSAASGGQEPLGRLGPAVRKATEPGAPAAPSELGDATTPSHKSACVPTRPGPVHATLGTDLLL